MERLRVDDEGRWKSNFISCHFSLDRDTVKIIVMKLLGLVVLFLPATYSYQCPHGKNLSDGPAWMGIPELKEVNDDRIPSTPDRHTVNLDLPPQERWVEIGKTYRDKSDLIIQVRELASS